MYPVLFVLIMVVGVALVAASRNRKTRAVQAGRDDVLRDLAPVISGSVSKDLTLTGPIPRSSRRPQPSGSTPM